MTFAASIDTASVALSRELAALSGTGVVPGGCAVVTTADRPLYEHAFGARALVPEREEATTRTLWDCASLTKPLVTAALALRLRAEGRLDFDADIGTLVPEMGGGASGVRLPRISELLLHAGGLPAWRPLYALVEGGLPERASFLAGDRSEPGLSAIYGCPGYQVLGLAIERATSRTLADLAAEVLWPGRDDLFFPLPAGLAASAAPTEDSSAFERDLAGDAARGYTGWRDGIIRGQVHDQNAFSVGGAAGNAGLFGTAAGVAWLAARFLEPGDLLDASDLFELSRDLAPQGKAGESRTWGFQLASSPGSAAGPALSERCFGHAGFTGTSVYIDPDRGAAYVLLTNRVHPRWTDHPFHSDRRRFHASAAALVEAARG